MGRHNFRKMFKSSYNYWIIDRWLNSKVAGGNLSTDFFMIFCLQCSDGKALLTVAGVFFSQFDAHLLKLGLEPSPTPNLLKRPKMEISGKYLDIGTV